MYVCLNGEIVGDFKAVIIVMNFGALRSFMPVGYITQVEFQKICMKYTILRIANCAWQSGQLGQIVCHWIYLLLPLMSNSLSTLHCLIIVVEIKWEGLRQ